ncbi:recombinase family protein [Pseudomonas alloputida]|uniref:recombinase family protein n=1 Tax=Pseudomonas alloputida TaxID=1940621 RepID=UPI001E552E91|nr:recombinase family protein [Pseudomonas alloputida]MCE1061458.1 recombinase family protein [Pseudomonas alloputida]
MPYAVGYARFSSIKQGKGTSLARQQELIAEWISNNSQYTLYPKKFQDLGRSASKGEHLKHGLGQLLEAIKQGEIKEGDVILVEAIDRIGRLPQMQMFSLINDIITAKVKIVTLQDCVTYGPDIRADQIWALLGKVQQAFNYSESLSLRIKASYKKREEIAKHGSIPKRRTPIWLNSDGTLKDTIAEAMKGAFEDALAGLGERRILKNLIKQHDVFEKINPSTIRRWLINRTAIGYWKDNKIYPPIVSEELFYQVQQRFEDEYKPATAPRSYFLSGLIRCGECGANMQIKVNKHSPFTMRCSTRCKFGDMRCQNEKSFPIPVLMHICQDTATPALEKAMQNIQLTSQRKQTIIIDGQLREVHKRISNLVESIARYGAIPEVDQQISAAIEERKKLEQRKLFLDTELEANNCKYDEAWDYQYDLIENNPMRLNALLQSAEYSITCYRDGKMNTSTHGNEFSRSQYIGHSRKKQAYAVLINEETKYITSNDEMAAIKRIAAFRKFLEDRRQHVKNAKHVTTPLKAEDEVYEFYKTIEA